MRGVVTLNPGNSSSSSLERSSTSLTGTSVSGRLNVDIFSVRRGFFGAGNMVFAMRELRLIICAVRVGGDSLPGAFLVALKNYLSRYGVL